MTFLHASGKLDIWLPDIDFSDGQSVSELQTSLRLKPKGIVYWSRHISLTTSQTSFNYVNYPLDTQTIAIRFESYAFPSTLLSLAWASPPLQLYNDGDGVAFTQNPLWTYQSYSLAVNQVDNSLTRTPRYFTQASLYLYISRQSGGIIVRLAVPFLVIVLLGACSFWGKRKDRFVDTIPLVLAAAALYIAVLQTIPTVGYLTKYDQFSLAMIAILAATCAAHRFISHVDKGASKYPAREILIRLTESFFRILLLPIIIAVFIIYFGHYFDSGLLNASIVLLSLGVFVISLREVGGLMKSLQIFDAMMMKKVVEFKPLTAEEAAASLNSMDFNRQDVFWQRIKKAELIFFNFRHRRVISSSIAMALEVVEELHKKQQSAIEREHAIISSSMTIDEVYQRTSHIRKSFALPTDFGSIKNKIAQERKEDGDDQEFQGEKGGDENGENDVVDNPIIHIY